MPMTGKPDDGSDWEEEYNRDCHNCIQSKLIKGSLYCMEEGKDIDESSMAQDCNNWEAE